eukprot:SAG22_NODE_769_length_7337_cov_15.897624_2_plen_103_part_00
MQGKGRGGVAGLVGTIAKLGPENLPGPSRAQLLRWAAGVRRAVAEADRAGLELGKTDSLRSTDSGTSYVRKFAQVMSELSALIGGGGSALSSPLAAGSSAAM